MNFSSELSTALILYKFMVMEEKEDQKPSNISSRLTLRWSERNNLQRYISLLILILVVYR